MFDTNNKSFKFKELPGSDSFIEYEFYNDNGQRFLAYFDIQSRFAELSFEYDNKRGFDIFMADGCVIEKLNTCREMCLHFMERNSEKVDALWWQATPSRYRVYKRYFESQGNIIPDLPLFQAMMVEDNYGVSGMVRNESELEKIVEFYHG